MIDLNPAHFVAQARDATGRFVLFTNTDLPANYPLSFYGVVLDQLGDAFGLLVRTTDRDRGDGWTAAELLQVALARAKAEGRASALAAGYLASALAAHQHAHAPAVAFLPGAEPSALPWTVAVVRGHSLPFSPDADGEREGVTLHQLVIVLDRLYRDWALAPPATRRALKATLAAYARASRAGSGKP